MIDASEQIEKFKEFFDSNYIDQLHELSKTGKVSLLVDFSKLNRSDPELADQLLDEPDETLKAAEVSLGQFDIEEIENVKIRFFNLPTSQGLRIRDIRSEHIGKFIFIEGLVKQATDVRPQIVTAKFECPACGNTISIMQVDVKFKEPVRCSCGRHGRFRLINKELIDAQKIVVEESPEFLIGGEQPKRLNIFLKGDLVEPIMEKKTTPGSKVRIVGVINEIPILLKTGGASTRYDLMMETNFIEPLEETFDDIKLAKEDVKEIKKLAKDPKIYEKLVGSIAPSIYGHKDIKQALVLQLVGGVKKERKDGTSIRGDMHILLVGDPGAAKSSMLMYISKAAPRARYVAGKGVTGAGLTASVVKDEFLRGWALEAGALVLANNGVVCLHPDTSVVVDNNIKKISNVFNENNILFGKYKNEIIEYNNIKKNIFGFDLDKLNIKNNFSTLIGRKKYYGNLLNLKFKSGFSIKLTPNHMLVNAGDLKWKKAKKFKIGQKVFAPLKLPSNKKDVFVFDLIPPDWKVMLDKKEKTKLKKSIRRRFNTLSEFNRLFDLDRNHLSGGKQMVIEKFSEIIKYLEEEDYWKNIPLKFGKNKNGERLKILKISPELGYVLGFIYGDGYVNVSKRRTSIQIIQSVKHQGYIDRLKDYWNKISGKKLNIYNHKVYPCVIRGQEVKSKSRILYCGSNLIGLLYNYFVGNSLKNILSLPDDVLKAFISGVMDSDGCISKKQCTKNGKNYFTQHINFLFSNNLRDNLNFLLALRRLDCYGKIYDKKNIKSIVLSGRKDVSCLIDKLKLFSIKISKANLLVKNKQISCDSDKIPFNIAQNICNRILKLNKSLLVKRGIWSTVYSFKYLKREPSRDQIIKIINRTKDLINDDAFVNNSLNLVKRDYFLDEIVDIKTEKYKGYVYDLFVPKDHNFLADGIIVHNCIDEMDKISVDDTGALHEAMAQQQISISKANIQATLKSQTTVLAAANPKLGRFDPYQPIASQIDMPPALINRFDLIFPVRDIPNEKIDSKIASHVLIVQQREGGVKPDIEPSLLKKYISYVRVHCRPKLSDGAIDEIKSFYVKLRNTGSIGDDAVKPIPISARQLESLIRLAEASAKIRLSNEVTRMDARKAISILQDCLKAVGFDYETGKFDIDRISTGIPTAQRNKIIVVRDIIDKFDKEGKKTIPIEDILAEATDKGISESDVEEVINKLSREGEIFSPKRGFLQKI